MVREIDLFFGAKMKRFNRNSLQPQILDVVKLIQLKNSVAIVEDKLSLALVSGTKC